MESHEELISIAFTVYRNSTSKILNQEKTDAEIINTLKDMSDGFLYGFIKQFS